MSQSTFFQRVGVGRQLAGPAALFLVGVLGLGASAVLVMRQLTRDAAWLNLAHHQRVLGQEYLTAVLSRGQEVAADADTPQQTFRRGVQWLTQGRPITSRVGGEQMVALPPAPTEAIRRQVVESGEHLAALSVKADQWLQAAKDSPTSPAMLQDLLHESRQMQASTDTAITQFTQLAIDRWKRLLMTIVSLGLALGVLGALYCGWLSRSMVRSLNELAHLAERIAAGDLTLERQKTVSQDAMGRLRRGFEQMTENLRTMVSQTLAVAERVWGASQQLASATQQMNAATQEISTTVQQIAKGAEKTSARIGQTSQVALQMNQAVQQVTVNAEQAAAASLQAQQTVRAGREAAATSLEKMEKITEMGGQTAATITRLGQMSEQVGEIVVAITDIADQTNLLALNAAIEAARAGETGRGFAVVAEEVRKLAEGSGRSAQQLAQVLAGVSQETNRAVQVSEQGSREIVDGRAVVSRVNQAFNEIVRTAEQTQTMVQQISTAAKDMIGGTAQVTQSVSEILATAEEVAAATQETSASTEEMTASMEELAASAQELAEMAATLRVSVGKFAVGQGGGVAAVSAPMPRETDRTAPSGASTASDSFKARRVRQLAHGASVTAVPAGTTGRPRGRQRHTTAAPVHAAVPAAVVRGAAESRG